MPRSALRWAVGLSLVSAAGLGCAQGSHLEVDADTDPGAGGGGAGGGPPLVAEGHGGAPALRPPKPSPDLRGDYGKIRIDRLNEGDLANKFFEVAAYITTTPIWADVEVIDPDDGLGDCTLSRMKQNPDFLSYGYSIGDLTITNGPVSFPVWHQANGTYYVDCGSPGDPQWGTTYTITATGDELPGFTAEVSLASVPIHVTKPDLSFFAEVARDNLRFVWNAAPENLLPVEIGLMHSAPAPDGYFYELRCTVPDTGEFTVAAALGAQFPAADDVNVWVDRVSRVVVDLGQERTLEVEAVDHYLSLLPVK